MSVSDWITFLTSERDVAYSAILNVGAILIAFVGLIFATKTVGNWQVITDGIVALAFLIYALIKVFNLAGKKGKVAERLLKEIIAGNLKTPDEIKQAWLNR